MASCLNNPDRDFRRRISNLVGDLDKFEPKVKALFEQSHCCDVPTVENDNANINSERTGSSCLFTPASDPPVPKKGRQTYRMWRAMVQLDSSPFTKSRLETNPKCLHFIPLEEYHTRSFNMEGFESIAQFLVVFLRAFFPGLNVSLDDKYDIASMNPISRYHKLTNKKQFLVTDIYTRLHQMASINKKDYVLGLTWTDLYPSEELNFALGEALYSHRCAVFSFGRYEPLSFSQDNNICEDRKESDSTMQLSDDGTTDGDCCSLDTRVNSTGGKLGVSRNEKRNFSKDPSSSEGTVCTNGTLPAGPRSNLSEEPKNKVKENFGEQLCVSAAVGRDGLQTTEDGVQPCELDGREDDVLEITGDLLWKMMRVSSHEVCHLFGMSHCVFFNCAMNESKSVTEALNQPLQLCPICLRKLQKFFNFDLLSRYKVLLDVCQKGQSSYPSERLGETVAWLTHVLQYLSIGD